MKRNWTIAALAFCLSAGWGVANLNAQQTPPFSPKADQRDQPKTEPTLDPGKNGGGDRELMQKIRRSIMDDKSLSADAHNVKIVAQEGKVTLKGRVRSEDEKRTVEQKATDAAGAGNVTNEITVKPAK